MAIITKMITITITIIKIVTDKTIMAIKIVAKTSGKITITTESKIITEENAVCLIFLNFTVGKKLVALLATNTYQLFYSPFALRGIFYLQIFTKYLK